MPSLSGFGKPFRMVGLQAIFLLAGVFPVAAPLSAQPKSVAEKGPPVGQKLPAFTARDQFGKQQTLASLAGAHGLVLLFVRSADW